MTKRPNGMVAAVIALVIGVGIGVFAHSYTAETGCDLRNFHLINPALGCNTDLVVSKRAYIELKHSLESFIQQKIEGGEVSGVSVYFRDLNDGPTLGIAEHEKFSPASLLKLPMLLAYLDLEEEDGTLGATQVVFDGYDVALDQDIAPKELIEPNTPYRIDDLLGRMIKYSDNRAYYVLREYLHQLYPDSDVLGTTFVGLGIVDPKTPLDQTISVKSYASIFVQLYNASYFQNKELSERALSILTDVDYKRGINEGVPAGIQVAHKFGERTGFDGGLKQLHDCGIVYYPENAYLICIMTRGGTWDQLEEAIAAISRMVYEEVDSRRI